MSYFSALTQNVIASTLNSSNTMLSGSASYTGSSDSTLGVAAIQIMFRADTNCLISVDQSGDGTNWDLIDNYQYYYTVGNFGVTVQAIGSYFRVRVLNQSTSAQTVFRLSSVLCPIVEAVPRTLDSSGYFQVAVKDFRSGELGTESEVDPMGNLRTITPVKLVGATFIGNTVDAAFWTTSSNGTAAVTQSIGRLQFSTGATAGSSCSLQSVRYGRYNAGAANYFRGQIRVLPQTGSCLQRWGTFDAQSGFYFEVSNSVFNLGYRNSGVDTKIVNGSFNGEAGNTYTIGTNVTTYELYWTNKSTYYVIDSTLIHKQSGNINPLSDTPTLPIRLELTNPTGASGSNNIFTRVLSINRLGPLTSNPTRVSATAAVTSSCKLGAGHLHKIIVGSINANGNSLAVFDGIVGQAGATKISTLTFAATNTGPWVIPFDCAFYTGLYVVPSAAEDITVVYE